MPSPPPRPSAFEPPLQSPQDEKIIRTINRSLIVSCLVLLALPVLFGAAFSAWVGVGMGLHDLREGAIMVGGERIVRAADPGRFYLNLLIFEAIFLALPTVVIGAVAWLVLRLRRRGSRSRPDSSLELQYLRAPPFDATYRPAPLQPRRSSRWWLIAVLIAAGLGFLVFGGVELWSSLATGVSSDYRRMGPPDEVFRDQAPAVFWTRVVCKALVFACIGLFSGGLGLLMLGARRNQSAP